MAKIAGLPADLLNRADTILTQLEGETVVIQPQEKVSSQEKPAIETHVNEQISLSLMILLKIRFFKSYVIWIFTI